MKVIELDLFGNKPIVYENLQTTSLDQKIKQAIKLIKSVANSSMELIEIDYSGGKDSDVILELVKMADIPYRAIYKNTTIDPSGTIQHCLNNNVEIIRKNTFAKVMQAKGFPTRLRRFCCSELKEYKVLDVAILGIRKSESVKRKKRYREPVICRMYGKKEKVQQVLPILNWTDKDVESFIKLRNIQCHKLYYDENGRFNVKRRLGCMGCPLKSDNGLSDFINNPRLVRFWIKNGLIWWKTHKIKKTKKKYANVYELFVRNVFFKDYIEFYNTTHSVFGNIDCKKFLEDYFGIELP